MREFDLVVIGAGPGGYEAALEAAEVYGMRTALIEKEEVGGTCLNHGCIPAKALLHSADLYRQAKEGSRFGVEVSDIRLDINAMQNHKSEVIRQLRDGILFRLKQQKVQVFRGVGRILNEHAVEVKEIISEEILSDAAAPAAKINKPGTLSSEPDSHTVTGRPSAEMGEASGNIVSTRLLDTEYILIAAGSKAVIPPIPGADLPGVMDSDALLDWRGSLFKRLLIIGGGVIGMEFASIYSSLGTEVTVVEALPRIIANMDKELSQSLKMLMKKRNVQIITDARVTGIRPAETAQYRPDPSDIPDPENGNRFSKSVLCCKYEVKGKETGLEADAILICTGRKPAGGGLFDETLGIRTEKGRILTDENGYTGVAGIYAIGDVTGGIMLAHAAAAAGKNAVAHMNTSAPGPICLKYVPSCIYTDPEIASTGLTLEAAKELGIDAASHKVLMTANGKTVLSGQERGFIKVVFEKNSRKILGAQLMCARASDIVSEFTQAIVHEMTLKDMAGIIRPHPTFCEAVTDAVSINPGKP